jgi:predicted RNA binding protein YcfA (HicA-like mRNA interferase family)
VKRVDLIRHLEAHGCAFVREGGEHTVYRHSGTGRQSPRRREIKEGLVRRICGALGIPQPST